MKIKWSDVPEDTTVMSFIRANSDWDEVANKFKGSFDPFLEFKLPEWFDHQQVREEVVRSYWEGNWHKWRAVPNGSYSGMAITKNPDKPPEDWYQGLLSHPRYQDKEDYYVVDVEYDKPNMVKGDYLDTLSFRHINEFAQAPMLNKFLSGFTRHISRSRVGTVAGHTRRSNSREGWHVDEDPTCLMRVNTCLETNGDFSIQYCREGQVGPPTDQVIYKSGESKIVNTDVSHRVAIIRDTVSVRTHLVLGITPWLDYDKDEDSWVFNEYYGKIHPYDMVREGLIWDEPRI